MMLNVHNTSDIGQVEPGSGIKLEPCITTESAIAYGCWQSPWKYDGPDEIVADSDHGVKK